MTNPATGLATFLAPTTPTSADAAPHSEHASRGSEHSHAFATALATAQRSTQSTAHRAGDAGDSGSSTARAARPARPGPAEHPERAERPEHAEHPTHPWHPAHPGHPAHPVARVAPGGEDAADRSTPDVDDDTSAPAVAHGTDAAGPDTDAVASAPAVGDPTPTTHVEQAAGLAAAPAVPDARGADDAVGAAHRAHLHRVDGGVEQLPGAGTTSGASVTTGTAAATDPDVGTAVLDSATAADRDGAPPTATPNDIADRSHATDERGAHAIAARPGWAHAHGPAAQGGAPAAAAPASPTTETTTTTATAATPGTAGTDAAIPAPQADPATAVGAAAGTATASTTDPGAAATAAGTASAAAANAAPATAPTTTTPAAAPAWPDQVAAEVRSHLRSLHRGADGVHRAVLVVHAEGLGQVRIDLRTQGAGVDLVLRGADPASQEALRHALPQLREVLTDSGLTVGSTDVSDLADQWTGGGSGDAQPSAPARSTGPRTTTTTTTTAATTSPSLLPRTTTSAVDVLV